jgi:hypothetical protein
MSFSPFISQPFDSCALPDLSFSVDRKPSLMAY